MRCGGGSLFWTWLQDWGRNNGRSGGQFDKNLRSMEECSLCNQSCKRDFDFCRHKEVLLIIEAG